MVAVKGHWALRSSPTAFVWLGPRTDSLVRAMRACAGMEGVKAKFCGYLRMWIVTGNEPSTVMNVFNVLSFLLSPRPMPAGWLDQLPGLVSVDDPSNKFFCTPDGYVALMKKDAPEVFLLHRLIEGMGDDAVIDWNASGCEIVLRKNSLHRQVRAWFTANGFALMSAPGAEICRYRERRMSRQAVIADRTNSNNTTRNLDVSGDILSM